MITRSLFLLIATLGLSQAQPCNNETESLFQIDFDISRDAFRRLRGQDFFWRLWQSSNSSIRHEWYESFDDVPALATQCIPKDECVVLSVNNLRTDQFSIRVDGEAVTPSPPFPYRQWFFDEGENASLSTTELGDCIPTCGDGEAVFDLAAFYVDPGIFEWRLEDVKNQRELMACDRFMPGTNCNLLLYRLGLYHSRRCLPVDGCYRMIVSDRYWPPPRSIDPTWLFFNITFDGELVRSVQDFRFDAVDFGSQCSACNENESLLEFFLWRTVFFDTYPHLSWAFEDNETPLLDGIISWNDTAMQHVHECVSSDACITFSASVPETTNVLVEQNRTLPYYESDPYRLSVDGVLFVDRNYQFGEDLNDYTDADGLKFLEKAVIGQCVAADLCDTEVESLFDLQLETGSVGPDPWDVSWWVLYDTDELELPRDLVAWHAWWYDDFLSDSSYHTYKCIPKEERLIFKIPDYAIKDGNEVSKYTVSVDGVILEDRDCEETRCEGDMITVLSGSSSSELSAGAIAGIVVGSVVALALIALVGYKVYTRKASATSPASPSSQQDEEEAANESK